MLIIAGGRQQIRTDERTIGATQYLLDLIATPESVTDLPLVRVDHPDALALLDLGPSEGGCVSLSAIEPHWAKVADQARRAAGVEPRDRDSSQRAVTRNSIRLEAAFTCQGGLRMQDSTGDPMLYQFRDRKRAA